MDKVEIRAVIKYIYRKGMSPKEIHDDFIKTTLGWVPSYSKVKKLAAEIRRGRQRVEDYEWSGHPKGATTDENVELVHSLIMMSKVSARWVPRMLTKDQKKSRFVISLLSLYEDDPEEFMSNCDQR